MRATEKTEHNKDASAQHKTKTNPYHARPNKHHVNKTDYKAAIEQKHSTLCDATPPRHTNNGQK